jgi:WD40 repeat protein
VLWEVGADGRVGGGQAVQRGEPVWQVAFSPVGGTFAVSSGNGSVNLWRWDGDKAERRGETLRFSRRVTALAFSPDGRLLLTGGIDGVAQAWESETGRPAGGPHRTPGAVLAAGVLDD